MQTGYSGWRMPVAGVRSRVFTEKYMRNIIDVPVRDYSALPLRAVIFGGGNFMRGFIGWMLDILNERGLFSGSARIVKPTPAVSTHNLAAQGFRYTVLRRGVSEGWQTTCRRLITTLNGEVNPHRDWEGYLALAAEPELRFVFSNTTESGIAYESCPFPCAGAVSASFPAKLTAFMFERFNRLAGGSGANDAGLTVIPCELVENNGALLRELVLRHAGEWALPPEFRAWIEDSCVFCNTLVDSIVPGFPAAEADEVFRELDYRDDLLVAAELFNLLVIEAPKSVRRALPLEESGARVVWTDDLAPYRERKVRVLNGAHTSTVLAAYLAGLDTVGQMLRDEATAAPLERVIFSEILPALPLAREEKEDFARAVLERFANPYIRHELLAISLNSTAKWRVRVLPSLKDYQRLTGHLPEGLVFSWSALLCFYRQQSDTAGTRGWRCPDGSAPAWMEGGPRSGAQEYPVRDAAQVLAFFADLWRRLGGDIPALVAEALGNEALWGEDMRGIPGMAELAARQVGTICREGMRAALAGLQ